MNAIGVIGGSGLYDMDGLTVHETRALDTPFGSPSDAYVLGELEHAPVIFLPRHGKGHRLLPTELNFRANIYGFKALGVERIISVSAVGSLKEKYAPTHVVLPDQFLDRTRHRADTFFGRGMVAHVSPAHPVCPEMQEAAFEASQKAGAVTHRNGTYVCMEGPQFSTRAESLLYRSWGMDVIGMTNLQEARLAREAEICYVSVSMVTDYDCWHESEEDVTGTAVLEVIRANVKKSQEIIRHLLTGLPSERKCGCGTALDAAIVTDPALVPKETLTSLEPMLRRYLSRA